MSNSSSIPSGKTHGVLVRWMACLVLVNGWLTHSPTLARAQAAAPEALPSASTPETSLPAWLPWTFAGLGAASAVTALIGWQLREIYVERWNSGSCLQTGQTRVQVCPNDYHAARDAETVSWVTGVGAVAFIGTAFFLGQARATVSADQSSLRVTCSGTF